MKISRFDFPKQGENNRETHPTRRCSRCDVPQHFGNPNRRSRGREPHWHQLWRNNRVQAVIFE
jgi:hypothetical protein